MRGNTQQPLEQTESELKRLIICYREFCGSVDTAIVTPSFSF